MKLLSTHDKHPMKFYGLVEVIDTISAAVYELTKNSKGPKG